MGYLVVQAAAVLAWWAVMIFVPSTQDLFMAPGAPDSTLLAFVGADWLLYVGGSLAVAYGLVKERPWAWPALCFVAGAIAYAAFYGVGLPIASGGGWWGALLMLASLVLTLAFVWLLRPGNAR